MTRCRRSCPTRTGAASRGSWRLRCSAENGKVSLWFYHGFTMVSICFFTQKIVVSLWIHYGLTIESHHFGMVWQIQFMDAVNTLSALILYFGSIRDEFRGSNSADDRAGHTGSDWKGQQARDQCPCDQLLVLSCFIWQGVCACIVAACRQLM